MRPATSGILLLLALCGAGRGAPGVIAVPGGTGSAEIVREGGRTTVRLREPTRLDWSAFRVGRGESLRYDSGGRGYASLNRVTGQAVIDGSVVADGPFYLVSPAGIHVGATGRVTAPAVVLSGLVPMDEGAFLARGQGTLVRQGTTGGQVVVEGTVDSGGGTAVIAGSAVSLARTARVSGGVVQVMAAGRAAVRVPGGIADEAMAGGGGGSVNNEGWIQANRVEIFAEGFIRNGGRLLAEGQGNEIRLAASRVTHEMRPGNASLIRTSKLVVDPDRFVQEGPVLSPDDGANPSAVGGIRRTPRLSGDGFITRVSAGQTQLSHAPLQSARPLPSPIPPPRGPDQASAVAARGTGAEADRRTARQTRGAARRPAAAPGTVRKAAFFGQRSDR